MVKAIENILGRGEYFIKQHFLIDHNVIFTFEGYCLLLDIIIMAKNTDNAITGLFF